ncbi:MAG: hypothetical protein R2697_22315 [Ilumatobacteraceae bacterium]
MPARASTTPLGVNRTWLKYIETGEFLNTGRSFSVMRCNHCDDAVHDDLSDERPVPPTTVSSTSTTTAASAASRA